MASTTADASARQPPNVVEEQPITVLVTGFGPFLENQKVNPSWLIASSLPALIPRNHQHPAIQVHVHHAPLRVAYSTVLSTLPTLLPPTSSICPAPTIILHLGLAASRPFYALEQTSTKLGYDAIPDVDGHHFPDDQAELQWPSSMFPGRLYSGFDCVDVVTRCRLNLKARRNAVRGSEAEIPDVRTSSDAGNFLCGFIYYNSLASMYRLGVDSAPVTFLHVPDARSTDEGREVAVALIEALVESLCTVGLGTTTRGDVTAAQSDRPTMDANFA
ncbi:peptidase C15, pyroglutamyl peptidase I-like protein [Sporormia fimetaria CBS 119925]|uniref:Peptidase C15, pyroglutamyl peptidase I-like protein n=1 Tax=Sporormia fimetaria CBS 119925 TaxID=1340428 RepID=A0A6A6VAF9_9PLEO|nr:peptidase C15, pyroglutamyl peptidase I-like protein [Sporormia fimetaria CBS 119925]